jgi:hypothetical protein
MEMEEPNLAYSDDDRIDFEQLRRDLTPAQRLKLDEIQRSLESGMTSRPSAPLIDPKISNHAPLHPGRAAAAGGCADTPP